MVDRKELGQTEAPDELVPGRPEPLHRNAQALRDRARDVIADGEALKRIDTGGWTGPAHDAYAEDSANQWPKWLKLGDALEYGAEAVDGYANCLSWAQREAAQAVEEHRHGEQLSRQAHAAHEQAVAQADAQSRANAQHGGPAVQAPEWNDPGEAHRQAAREILDRARAQLEQVAGETAQVLKDLAGAVQTEDPESTAETITHAAADIVGFFPVVGDAVDLAHAGVYALQGKGLDAGITAAAAVPIGGWGAGAGKVGKAAEELAKGGKEADEAAEAAAKATEAGAKAGKWDRPSYVPSEWKPEPTRKGDGVIWKRPGATGKADSVRIMDAGADPRYPNGYVRFHNEQGQPLNLEGKPTGHDETHIPRNPDGSYPTPKGW